MLVVRIVLFTKKLVDPSKIWLLASIMWSTIQRIAVKADVGSLVSGLCSITGISRTRGLALG